VSGDAGMAEARRRFGTPADTSTTDTTTSDAPAFTMESIMDGKGRIGAAHAAARAGDKDAATALAELRRAVAGIDHDQGDDAA
jgi:hypothetical protein